MTEEKLNERQRQVYEAIEEYSPVCDRQIAASTGLPINAVTPRRGELLKKHRITEAYVGIDVTGRRVTYWKPIGGFNELADIA